MPKSYIFMMDGSFPYFCNGGSLDNALSLLDIAVGGPATKWAAVYELSGDSAIFIDGWEQPASNLREAA